jgi:hypothetical protein
MSIPKHLGAFDGRAEEYEWTRIEPVPAKPASAPSLFMPELFHADILKWSEKYAASLLSNPEWHKEQERKAADRAAKNQSRLARIAERRKAA